MSESTPARLVHDEEIAAVLLIKKETARKNLRSGVYGAPRSYGRRSGLPRDSWEAFLRRGHARRACECKRGPDGKFVSTNGKEYRA